MSITTIFFDLDDTLYSASSGLWQQIRERIGMYMRERLNIPADQVDFLRQKLFEQYGTTLRGLQVNYQVDVPDFLAYVHDVPVIEYLQPNPLLCQILQGLPARKFIFTNADVPHARRVLRVLQLEECFEAIIDVVAIDPYCKPMPEAFAVALKIAGESDPRRCVMLDDIPRTTRVARQLGMYAILCGQAESHPDADATLVDWADLPELLNMR